jgi:hypothetical protein
VKLALIREQLGENEESIEEPVRLAAREQNNTCSMGLICFLNPQ